MTIEYADSAKSQFACLILKGWSAIQGHPSSLDRGAFPPLALGNAGWSSPVARQAHNLKVVGSNPTPATNLFNDLAAFGRFCIFGGATFGLLFGAVIWHFEAIPTPWTTPNRYNENMRLPDRKNLRFRESPPYLIISCCYFLLQSMVLSIPVSLQEYWAEEKDCLPRELVEA